MNTYTLEPETITRVATRSKRANSLISHKDADPLQQATDTLQFIVEQLELVLQLPGLPRRYKLAEGYLNIAGVLIRLEAVGYLPQGVEHG